MLSHYRRAQAPGIPDRDLTIKVGHALVGVFGVAVQRYAAIYGGECTDVLAHLQRCRPAAVNGDEGFALNAVGLVIVPPLVLIVCAVSPMFKNRWGLQLKLYRCPAV